MEKINESPFVGCYKVEDRCFVYDVNTNEILEVGQEIFNRISSAVDSPENAREHLSGKDISILQERGFLSSKRPEGAIGFCSDCLAKGHQSEINQVTLELTQACNHRCLYCPYSSNDEGRRGHAEQTMNWGTAQKGIDLLLENSSEVEWPALGYYGGEPLLEWDLLRRCLEYTASEAKLPILQSLTTNATLITEEIAGILAEHEVSVLVSLDGPEVPHNQFRKLVSESSNGFSSTMRGIKLLRKAYGEKATSKIRINAVYGPWTEFPIMEEFFRHNPPPAIKGLRYQFSRVNHPKVEGFAPRDVSIRPEVSDGDEGTLFERWINLVVSEKTDSPEGNFLRSFFEVPIGMIHNRSRSPLGNSLGPMGMCKPGVRKCYISVDGKIIVCERVHERYEIGNLHDGGIDIEKCKNLVDELSAVFTKSCPDCIFCRICSGCPSIYADENGEFDSNGPKGYCEKQVAVLSEDLMRYTGALIRNPQAFQYLEKHQIDA